jgi:MOSC domain-containing protein YiiM
MGNRYRIGSALFEVTEPRVTCYRVGIRMGEPAMSALLVSHHRRGFYFVCWRKAKSLSESSLTQVGKESTRDVLGGSTASQSQLCGHVDQIG